MHECLSAGLRRRARMPMLPGCCCVSRLPERPALPPTHRTTSRGARALAAAPASDPMLRMQLSSQEQMGQRRSRAVCLGLRVQRKREQRMCHLLGCHGIQGLDVWGGASSRCLCGRWGVAGQHPGICAASPPTNAVRSSDVAVCQGGIAHRVCSVSCVHVVAYQYACRLHMCTDWNMPGVQPACVLRVSRYCHR